MTDISVLIVDDEAPARANLVSAISNFPNWRVVAELENGTEIIKVMNELSPDIIFLDIKMPHKNGIQIMKELLELKMPPLVVFVTAYEEHAIQAFDLHSIDYLLKPFSNERFLKTVRRVEKVLNNDFEKNTLFNFLRSTEIDKPYLSRILISSVGNVKIIDVESIYSIKGSGNYVEIMHRDGIDLHRISLSNLDNKLDPSQFVRTHRSAIVNINTIKEICSLGVEKYEILLTNNVTVKLGKNYRNRLLTKLETV